MEILSAFEKIVWVSVGQEPDIRELQDSIHHQLTKAHFGDDVTSEADATTTLRDAATGSKVLLVLDAGTGQNAINQAEEFRDTAGVTGLVLTKLDGTAKGGVVLAISDQLQVPVRFVGVGEKMEDLQEFHPMEFVDSLLPQSLDPNA